MIKLIKTNNFFVSANLIFSFFTSPAFYFIIGSASNFVAGSILSFVNDFISDSITIFALGAIADRIIPIIINFKTTFFCKKQVTAEDYISFKLYIKGII